MHYYWGHHARQFVFPNGFLGENRPKQPEADGDSGIEDLKEIFMAAQERLFN